MAILRVTDTLSRITSENSTMSRIQQPDFWQAHDEHITPVLRDLHWLPVHDSIRFKILLMTFKCLNQLAPSYLSDLLIHYRPSRTSQSSHKELLVQPRCHLKTYGERAFSFIAPKLWNTLPLSIKLCKSARRIF